MLTFIHTADIHFGMENYGRLDPQTGIHTRLLDFEKALNFCIDFAIDNKIDFFLFSGDAYKTAHPSPTQQRLLLGCFLRLYKAGIPIIIVVGNHDNPLSFGKTNALEIFGQLPVDGFYVISKPDTILLQTKNGPVQIVGIPWPTRNNIAISDQYAHSSAMELTGHISAAVGSIIKTLASALDQKIPAVLAGHLTVSNGIFSGSEKRAVYGTDPVLLPSQLAIEPFDYVALGHLHRFQNLNPNGYPAVIYSGSIERVDFGERKEQKGFCFVKIESKGSTTYEFIKTPTRPFIQIEVELSGENHTQQIIDAINKHNIEDAVLKIIYFVTNNIREKVDIPLIQQACSKAMFVAGIIPIRTYAEKEKRAAVKVDMDMTTLLGAYLDSKPELKNKKEALIKKILELESECC